MPSYIQAVIGIIMSSEQQIEQRVNSTVHNALDTISQHSERYQSYVLAYLCALFVIMSFSVYAPTILYMNPEFTCAGSQQTFSEHEACRRLDSCELVNIYTLTSKLKMYCGGRSNDRNVIQSMYGLGCIVGVLAVNWLSSIKGKVLGFYISLAMSCLHAYALLLGAYVDSLSLLIISQFLGGASHIALYILCFLMLQKYGSKFARMRISAILTACNNGMWTGLFCFALRDWQYVVFFLVIAYSLLLVPTYFVLRQDPIYLFNSDRLADLKSVLAQISVINEASDHQLKQAYELLDDLQGHLELNAQNGTRRQSMCSQFTWKVIKMLAIFCSLDVIYNTVCMGNSYEIQQFQVDPILMEMAQSLGEFAACVFVAAAIVWMLKRFTRKTTIIFFAAFSIAYFVIFLTSFPTLSDFTALLSFFFLKMVFNIFFVCYSLSYVIAFPRQIQNNCLSIMAAMGGVGKILGPLSIRIAQSNSINPFVVFGIGMVVLAIVPTSFMDHIK